MNYKNITLITNTDIIKQIFKLVCNKLSLNLEIYPDDTIVNKTDILIYEDINYNSDELIRYRSSCSVLAVIATKKVYEYEGCYLIKKPFLPSQLIESISELINNITENIVIDNKKEELEEINFLDNNIAKNDISGEVDDLVDFIDNMEDNKNNELIDDEDIVIHKDDLGHGGVLDQKELLNLHDIISEENEISNINEIKHDDEWLELNDIIDDVIDDITHEPIEKEEEILLVLNRFTMDELSPLLNKLNQDVIDKISTGNDVNIKLRLEN